MTELKTLKDLFKETDIQIGSDLNWMNVYLNFNRKIKAEAVKWIKKWNVWHLNPNDLTQTQMEQLAFSGMVGMTHAFMTFFNLTEDDLK